MGHVAITNTTVAIMDNTPARILPIKELMTIARLTFAPILHRAGRAKSRRCSISPTKGAIRKKEKRKVESMVVERASRVTAAAAATAAAEMAAETNRHGLRSRSHSI